MNHLFVCMMVIISGVAHSPAQAPLGSGKSPKEVIDQLWKSATEGDLLTADGWNRVSGFFLQQSPSPGNSVVRVVSNYWGVGHASVDNDAAEVDVEYSDAGKVDSLLQYSPPLKTTFYKTVTVFHLVFAPTKLTMFKSDGKKIYRKRGQTGTRGVAN